MSMVRASTFQEGELEDRIFVSISKSITGGASAMY